MENAKLSSNYFISNVEDMLVKLSDNVLLFRTHQKEKLNCIFF